MTSQQMQWAMQHDWYVYASTVAMTGEIVITVRDGLLNGRTLKFTDFDKLRTWAGY